VLVALLAAACSPAQVPSPSDAALLGGTLRVALAPNGVETDGLAYYDPAQFFGYSPLFRCCLTRTLMGYNGLATEDGGAELRPDLASEMPDVSADGLTWTFTMQSGLHYAPPLEDRVIETRDIITALEYGLRRYQEPIFTDIVGASEFVEGSVDTVAGLEAPDATTLVVHLVAPAGDLGNRFASNITAPIPAEALAGREEGGYAGFLVSSGPYMYLGAESMDIADPDAPPIWAGREGEPVTLVRNPSWDRSTDHLRGAYVDRIEATLSSNPGAAAALVHTGTADVMGEPAPMGVVEQFMDDPERQALVHAQSAFRFQYIAFNLAMPPFDDVHVRRAANLVIDRAAAAAAMQEERQTPFAVANHAIPDPLLNNLLIGYAPFATSGSQGDLGAAQDEMRASRYDDDGDGSCDAAACMSVETLFASPGPTLLQEAITADLARIGIGLVAVDRDPFDPRSHVAATVGIGWGADFPVASNFGGLWQSTGLADGETNISLLGASNDDLATWGYETRDVPSLDSWIQDCSAASGSEGFLCWATVDQIVMERAVAWAPLGFAISAWITSDRVAEFAPDVNSLGPSLDRIQLREDP